MNDAILNAEEVAHLRAHWTAHANIDTTDVLDSHEALRARLAETEEDLRIANERDELRARVGVLEAALRDAKAQLPLNADAPYYPFVWEVATIIDAVLAVPEGDAE